MKKRNLTLILPLLFSFFLLAQATAASESGYRLIGAPETHHRMTSDNAVAIHVLSRIEFEIQHITDSINIPITELPTTEKLPPDKATPLIFYCMGQH